jgi:hypothetical protein
MSSPQSGTPVATSIPSTVQTKLPANILHALLQSGPVARLLKWPRFFVFNLHPNILHECHPVWMTKSRGSRTGNVSREGGGLKMRQHRSLGSGTGDIETVPATEPEGVAGSSKTTSSTPVRLRCRTLSEYVEPERHRNLTTRKRWL